MINYKQHLKKITLINFAVTLLFFGCEKKDIPEEYVARVNDEYLTEEDIEEELENSLKFREEFINQWIENELLLQEAVNSGVFSDENYEKVVERSKKELAAAMLLRKYFDKVNTDINEETLKDYFRLNREDFKLPQDAYIVNSADFSSEEAAISFRNYLVENNWQKSVEKFNAEEEINIVNTQKLLFPFQIQPVKLFRIINEMMPGEVSIIVETEPNTFTIVQFIKKFQKEEIPDFKYVKSEVKERFLTYQKKLIYKEFIEKLYTENQVEVYQ